MRSHCLKNLFNQTVKVEMSSFDEKTIPLLETEAQRMNKGFTKIQQLLMKRQFKMRSVRFAAQIISQT